MLLYEPSKKYLLNVLLKNGRVITDLVLYGKDVESSVDNIFMEYAEIKKVIVYDDETKEAVHIYR